MNVRRLFNFQAPGDGVIVSPLDRRDLGRLRRGVARGSSACRWPSSSPRTRRRARPSRPTRRARPPGTRRWSRRRRADQARERRGRAGAYPLVKVDYAMVPTSGLTTAKADDIAAFLQFTCGRRPGPESLLPPGYLPLPADLRAQTTAARTAVLAAAGPRRRRRRTPRRATSRRTLRSPSFDSGSSSTPR